ncbi:MAG: AtpZ/AtpI family protein [Pleurocapsa sp.]
MKKNFQRQIANKSDRKIKARKEAKNIWFGLGMFGMVGWSVAIPSLLGIGLGVWIDTHIKSKYSWTLMSLLIGVALGCFNAWYWISKESQND